MNKKIFLLLPLACSLLAGCHTKNEKKEKADDSVQYIADFESWGPDFQIIKMNYKFGKITRNDVKKYVKKGNYSAKVQPTGHPRYNANPIFYFPLLSSEFDFNYGDLCNYDSLCFSFYNDSDEPVKVRAGVITAEKTIYEFMFSIPKEFVLEPHKWNDITYDIDVSQINMFTNINEVPGVGFEFDKTGYEDPSFAPTLYMDEVYFKKASKYRGVEQIFTLKENEICDFEEEFQKSFFSISNAANNHIYFDIVESAEEGQILPTSGHKMLHIHSNTTPNSRWYDWSHFVISESYMTKTDMTKISIDEAENQEWAFCYDVRVANIESQSVVPHFFNPGMSNTKYIGGDLVAANNEAWRKISIVFNKEYIYNNGVKVTIDIGYLLMVGQFDFSIPNDNCEYDVYIDNIHLEKVGDQEARQ